MKKILSLLITAILLFSTVYADVEFNLSSSDCGRREVAATYGNGTLTASADGENAEIIRWDTDPLRLAPRIQGKNSVNGWKQGGYWQIRFSSADMEKVILYADMFSSGNGPASFKLQYSLNGTDFNDIAGSVVNMEQTVRTSYNGLVLPSVMAGKDTVYLRFVINSPYSLNDSLITGVKMGSTYLNNISLISSSSGEDNTVPDTEVKPVLFETRTNKLRTKWGDMTGKYHFFVEK